MGNKTNTINAYILDGSLIDLSGLDFSCVNLRMVNLSTEDLANISLSFKPLHEDYYSLMNIISKDAKKIQSQHTPVHVLLPIDFSKQVKNEVLRTCIDVMKLLFPSDFELHSIAQFQLHENNTIEWLHSRSYHFYQSGAEVFENYLAYPIEKEITEINEFISRFFSQRQHGNLFRMAFDAYLASFGPIPIHMSYISLCMAMETIVDGTSELLYRMRRSMALLCAENTFHGKRIYDNVKLIYDLRSNIVHGENINYALVYEYLPYLRSLISRMLIKIADLELKSATELQELLVFMGFNDRNENLKLEKPILNILTHNNTLRALSKKAKRT